MSSHLRISLVPLTALAVISSSAESHADSDTGLEVSLRPAYGAAGSSSPVTYSPTATARLGDPSTAGPLFGNTASPYGGGFNGQAQIGYRPIRWVSFGLSGGIRTSSASSVDGVTNLSRSAFSAGPYVRGYFPTFFHFEPYLGVGAEYMHDAQTYNQTVSGVPASLSLVHYGVAIPITAGIDYRFLRYFAVGPSFQYAPVIGADGCFRGAASAGGPTNSYCSGDSNPIATAKSYGVWSAGLDLRVTLF